MTSKSGTKRGRLVWLSLALVAVAVAISSCSQLRQVLPGGSQPTGTAVAGRQTGGTPAATGAAGAAAKATSSLPAVGKTVATPQAAAKTAATPQAGATAQAAPKAAATQPAAAQAQPTGQLRSQATSQPQAQPTGAPQAQATGQPQAQQPQAQPTGAAGAAAGAAGGAQPSGGQPGGLEGQAWKLTSYANARGVMTNMPTNARTTLEFNNGKITGNAACNSYFGSYSTNGNQVMISEVASTRKACTPAIMTLEDDYFVALQAAASYKITGDTLELMNNAGKTTLKYQVSKPVSLTTTRWIATGYNNGKGGVQTLAAGTEITAIFGTDGKVTGSAGCNSYNATYQTTDNNIQIGAPTSTRQACAQAVMQRENAYLAALTNATTYTIREDVLELRDGSGALIANYRASK